MINKNLLMVISDLHNGVVDIVSFCPLAENLGGAPLGDFGTNVKLLNGRIIPKCHLIS